MAGVEHEDRRTERVEEQLQDKRNRILQAVRQVVGEVGFRGAQIAMVAEAAGVATGTVYRYFSSKGELFAEVPRSRGSDLSPKASQNSLTRRWSKGDSNPRSPRLGGADCDLPQNRKNPRNIKR